MANRFNQPSFAGGELGPQLYGRVDLAKYRIGLKQARNFIVLPHGGAQNRAGLEFIGKPKYRDKRCRLVSMQAASDDTYVMEFGDKYIRFFRNGLRVLKEDLSGPYEVTTPYLEADLRLLKFGQSNDVITITHEKYTVAKLSRFAHNNWTLTTPTFTPGVSPPNTVTAVATQGTTDGAINTTHSYRVSAISEAGEESLPSDATPEINNDLQIKRNNFNTVTWDATGVVEFGAPVPARGDRDGGGQTSLDRTFRLTGGRTVTQIGMWSDVAQAIAVMVAQRTSAGNYTIVKSEDFSHPGGGWFWGVFAVPYVVPGSGDFYPAAYQSANTKQYNNAAESWRNGKAAGAQSGWTEGSARAPGTAVRVRYLPVEGAQVIKEYIVYKVKNGIWGQVGRTSGQIFVDDNIAVDYTQSPQSGDNPFAEQNANPRANWYHQQRAFFGGSLARPQTVWATQTANFNNMGVSSPAKDDDAIEFTIAAQSIQKILHGIAMEDMILFTPTAEWKVSGPDNGLLTPSSILLKPQSFYGSSEVPPMVVGDRILFVQAKGSIVRDIGFSFTDNRYVGNNLSILSPHLFERADIVEWSYAQHPNSVIHAAMSDGGWNCFTFLKEHEVWAWTPQQTDGYVESVAVVGETGESASYFATRRWVNGQWERFIERQRSRKFLEVEDGFFVDCGLSLDTKVSTTNFTYADPAVFTLAAHGWANGREVSVSSTIGPNGERIKGRYKIESATTNTFRLRNQETDDLVATDDWSHFDCRVDVRVLVTNIAGLDHLEGRYVVGLADGNVVGFDDDMNATELQVVGGAVQIPEGAGRVTLGLPYVSRLETLPLELTDQSVAGVMKSVTEVALRVDQTRGISLGADWESLVEYTSREDEGYYDPAGMIDGIVEVYAWGNWNGDGNICVEQRQPLPATILAAIPQLAFGS